MRIETKPMNELALSVLVVEDDEDTREAIGRAVAERGHAWLGAADGIDALQLLTENTVDLVLSDWRMPRMDGLELCRLVREREDAGYTYFMLMTGLCDREHLLAGLGAGADEYVTKPLDFDEFDLRMAAAERVVRSHKKLRRDSEGSFQLARMDALTGVGNRLRMEEDLRALVGEVRRYGKRCALALADVDHFKKYNDTYGHLAGDDLLRLIAQTIQSKLRSSDRLYRYGGEEFVVVFPEQSVPEATGAMERILAAVAETCRVTVSAGVAASGGAAEAKEWIAAADAALYRAKGSGRNRVEAA